MSVQLHAKRHPAAAGDQTLTVALCGSSRSPRSRSRACSRSAGSSGSPPRSATCASSWRTSPSWSIRRASTRGSTSLSRARTAGSLEVLADRSGLRAAILNLTLNAIEAAGQGGTVASRFIGSDDEVTVEVVDSGPGPPPELAETLCDPFVTSKPEGVGLGLALAQQVAADHGGRLSWTARAAKPASA